MKVSRIQLETAGLAEPESPLALLVLNGNTHLTGPALVEGVQETRTCSELDKRDGQKEGGQPRWSNKRSTGAGFGAFVVQNLLPLLTQVGGFDRSSQIPEDHL